MILIESCYPWGMCWMASTGQLLDSRLVLDVSVRIENRRLRLSLVEGG
jgi:hypothetical protein